MLTRAFGEANGVGGLERPEVRVLRRQLRGEAGAVQGGAGVLEGVFGLKAGQAERKGVGGDARRWGL